MASYIYIVQAPTLTGFKLGYTGNFRSIRPRYQTAYGIDLILQFFSCEEIEDEKLIHKELKQFGFSLSGELYKLEHYDACVDHCIKRFGPYLDEVGCETARKALAAKKRKEARTMEVKMIPIVIDSSLKNQCQHCGENLSTSRILKRHQTTSIYCLDIQRKKGLEVKLPEHRCNCGSNFTSKSRLTRHAKTCSTTPIINASDLCKG